MQFEQLSNYPYAKLPERATAGSAGYDFYCAAHTIVNPHSIALIPTGTKAQIDDGYYLMLAIRSSTPKKKSLMLANGVGIIDSDYYNNPDNEGHIMFQVYNFSDEPVAVLKDDKIGQGIFMPYLTTGDVVKTQREGGFGSTS